MYILYNGKIIDKETGEIVVSDPSPKFQNWKYNDYYNEFIDNREIRFLEPMTAKEIKQGEEIPTEGHIAEEKLDGHRATMFITSKGNRLFSRRISKKTNWYAENTDCLPHIRELSGCKKYLGTILDGEITMPTGVFADVQGVTGALPETALQNQGEKGFAIFNAFDILYYKGINIQAMPLYKRKLLLARVIDEIGSEYIRKVKTYATYHTAKEYQCIVDVHVESFKDLLAKMWEEGKEGLMIKDLNARYEQKRSKFFLKLKDCIYRDVVVMSYEEPTMNFDGKTDLDDWMYWYHPESDCRMEHKGDPSSGINECFPVTKPYCKGWIGAITCGVYKDGELKEVVSLKGFTDEDLEYIKNNKEKLIGTVLEVKAHQISDKELGTLRHPRFSRWRPDKDAGQCDWGSHVI